MRHYVIRLFPVLILLVGLGVGYGLSKLAAPEPPPVIEPLVPISAPPEGAAGSDVSTDPVAATPAPITIDTSGLPEAQQQLLSSFGITDSVTFTGEQVRCAEAAIGADRVAAIVAGGLPGPIELTKLLGCR